MGVASFIAKRLAFNRQKSFSRFVIRLSAGATVISVAVMIVTLAFVNGFQETISQKIFSFSSHVRIQYRQPVVSAVSEEVPIKKNDTLRDAVKQIAGVKSIHPYATKYAILKTKEDIEGLLFKGFDLSYDFNHLKPFMQEGTWIDFNDSTYSREIIISSTTAGLLKLKTGDKIFIYFIKPDGKLRPDRLTVKGIYKTGIEDYDKNFAIGDIRLIQRLNSWADTEIGGYEVYLNDYTKMDEKSMEIFSLTEMPQLWDSKTIKEIQPEIFDWLGLQDNTRDILIIIMIIVAIINLITCLFIIVLERIRMIGTLKALGATNWTIQKIFLFQSVFITCVGIIGGLLIGLGILWLQEKTGFISLPEKEYYVDKAAVKIIWWQVAAICSGTLVVCFLILMIPTIIVRKVQPVKAIQFR